MATHHWLGPAAWLAGGIPAVALVARLATDNLGANPVETLTHETGIWALRWLIASLAVTPVRRTLHWSRIAPLRRIFGLLAFAYAAAHLSVYAVLDQGLALSFVLDDVFERPYITVGFASFVLLVPLAVTSTRGWIRRLGKRWVTLHRLAYPAAIAAIVHFLWLVKADTTEPAIYATILALALIGRVFPAFSRT